MNVIKELKKIEKDLIQWRRFLHANPELGFELESTCKFITSKLNEFGVSYHRKFKGAVIGYINPEHKGKTIALRADMDALPIQELTNLEFASKIDGRMHACGHDAHTAQLLAAAKVLADHKNEINGRVMLIFQPAEELGSGSVEIANSEEFQQVDEILGCHDGNLITTENIEPGDLFFCEGPTMSTMDKFTIDIKGRGSHGSQPENSIDPITIGSYLVTAIQEIISREVSPFDPAVISFGTFSSGSAFNIIPETAHLEGTTRTLTPELREMTAKRIEEITQNVATAFRAEAVFKFFRQPPPVICDKHLTRKLKKSAIKLFPEKVKDMSRPLMGGEDFAFYLEKKPGAFFFMANPQKIDGKIYSHHNPKFALEEEVMYHVPAVMVQYIMDELGK